MFSDYYYFSCTKFLVSSNLQKKSGYMNIYGHILYIIIYIYMYLYIIITSYI